ncbi:MAG: class I SAM-dependent methyltransferase [Rhodospirillaceae bacterium]
MDISEFDRFADEYYQSHARNIQISGEDPEFFHEYKVADVAATLSGVPAEAGRRILDFGTGIGNSVQYLRRYFPDAQLTAVDISARSLAVARERFPDAADYQLISGVPIPLAGGSFDVVFTACVFHHISWSEHEATLKDLHRLLAPGGRLFIFEHNPWNPLTRHAVKTCPFDCNARLISSRILRRHVLKAGFVEASVRYRIFFPRFLAWFRRWEGLLAGVPLGAQYVLEARRAA